MSATFGYRRDDPGGQGISAPIPGIVDHTINSSDPRQCDGCKSGACNREKVWPTTPLLSDHGSPRVCPSCGGISVFASHLAMEGRACRYTSRGELVIAFYCAEYTRQHEQRDVSLNADSDVYMMGSWNGEAMAAVKGMAADVARVTNVARGFINDLGDHAHLRTLVDELRADIVAAEATIRRMRDAAKRAAAKRRKAAKLAARRKAWRK